MSNQNKKKFDLNDNFDKIFKSTNPNNNLNKASITEISINKLIPFKNHPFKLYEGERFLDMVESIKANGIIMPIIIRPLDDEIYEILSGHNRVEAAKSAELKSVPAIISENLNDDEALLIVTETNLRQRGFETLSHSEKAAALAAHHEAVKSQGKRTDLINEIENLLKNNENASNNANSETFSLIGKKLNNVEKLGQHYNLSKNSVARYLRINKLVNELKEHINKEEIPIYAGVELSYLSNENQLDLSKILSDNVNFRIDIKKAEYLREFSEKDNLTSNIIKDILSGVSIKKKNRASLPVQSLKIGGKMLSKYFKPEQKPEDIQSELFEALEFYRAHKNKF